MKAASVLRVTIKSLQTRSRVTKGTRTMKPQTAFNIIRSGQFRYLPAHFAVSRYRKSQIFATAPVRSARDGEGTEVHMLTGRSHIPDLFFAAKSFIREFGAPVRLIVHGDNSIGEGEVEFIATHLPDARIISPKESDPLVNDMFERNGLFECARFRRDLVLARKIFDTFVFSNSDRVILLDTDTLSFAPLDELRDHALATEPRNVFGRDPNATPYVSFDFGFSLEPYLNSGSSLISLDALRLERVEAWLKSGFLTGNHFSEQTMLAALATLAGVSLLSRKYAVGVQPSADAVFSHYCGHKLSAARANMRVCGQRRILERLA